MHFGDLLKLERKTIHYGTNHSGRVTQCCSDVKSRENHKQTSIAKALKQDAKKRMDNVR